MKRTRFAGDACPVARSLDQIGDSWTLLIIRNAFAGTKRFSDFRQQLGIAKNILSDRLAKLVDEGVFELQPDPSGSRHQEYHLTAKGQRLRVVLLALRQWGEDHLFDGGEEMTVLVDQRDGKPLTRLEPLSHDGRNLSGEGAVLELRKRAEPDA